MKYSAKVMRGKGRGRKLGFPTLNLAIPENFAADHGVYVTQVWLEGKEYAGALHYGPIPTFSNNKTSLEVFILDYKEKKRIDAIEFKLLHKIRDIIKFSSLEELKKQMSQDVIEIKAKI